MKIHSLTLGITTFAALLIVTSSAALAQFSALTTPTPTPTLTVSPLTGSTPTATPTVRIGSPGGATAAATTPAAGNALPTMMILGASLLLISAGFLTAKKFAPQNS